MIDPQSQSLEWIEQALPFRFQRRLCLDAASGYLQKTLSIDVDIVCPPGTARGGELPAVRALPVVARAIPVIEGHLAHGAVGVSNQD